MSASVAVAETTRVFGLVTMVAPPATVMVAPVGAAFAPAFTVIWTISWAMSVRAPLFMSESLAV